MLERSLDDGVLTITLDDGRRNAITPELCTALTAALDDAGDAQAVVLAGRPGAFSAGLDLGIMQTGDRVAIEELLRAVGAALMRLWTEPRPTVAAATGHALAGGTLLALACDHIVAAEDGAWGLIETTVGLELPEFAITLARHRLRTERFEQLLLTGARLPADAACEVGYVDEVLPADAVVDRAREHARQLAQLPGHAYGGSKARLRGADARAVLDGLAADVTALIDAFPGVAR